VGQDILHTQVDPAQVDGDDPVELFFRQVGKVVGLALDPGIILQNSWCAKVRDGFLDHPLYLFTLRDIGAKGERLSSPGF
jgi:hypothetical protein